MSPPVDPVSADEKLPENADVVVIGGGIVGVSAAYFLAKRGRKVALCEKGRIGGEQSSRNWGYCRQQGRDPAEIPLIMESLRIWRGIEAEIGDKVGFHEGGIMYLAETDKQVAQWEEWLDHARQYQLGTRLLSPTEVDQMVPGGSRQWRAGLWTATDGRAEPAMAAPAIARAAQRAGATVHTDCAVRGLETEGGRVSAVVTERGAIKTDAVLCAGGAWSKMFCRRHGVELPQLAVRSSVLRTGPAPEITDGGVSAPGFSIRRRNDGGYSVAFGGASTFDIVPDAFRWMRAYLPALKTEYKNMRLRFGRRFFEELMAPKHWPLDGPSPFEAIRVLDPDPDGSVLDKAWAKLCQCYPAMADVSVVESWAGMIDVTPDAVPVIGPVDRLPGLYLATGFSGHGFGIGPGAGRLAAEIVSGAATCVDPAPFRYERLVGGAPAASAA